MSASPTVMRVGASIAADLVFRPIGKPALIGRAELVQQALKVFQIRMRRLREVGRFHRRAGDHVDGHRTDRIRVLRAAHARSGERRRRHDDLPDPFGVIDGEVERDGAADAEAEDVSARHSEMIQHGQHIPGESCRGEGPVDVIRAPVPLEVDRDHSPARREVGDEGAELLIDVEQSAVQQHQRCAVGGIAVDLVVHAQGAEFDEAAFERRNGGCLIRHPSTVPESGARLNLRVSSTLHRVSSCAPAVAAS